MQPLEDRSQQHGTQKDKGKTEQHKDISFVFDFRRGGRTKKADPSAMCHHRSHQPVDNVSTFGGLKVEKPPSGRTSFPTDAIIPQLLVFCKSNQDSKYKVYTFIFQIKDQFLKVIQWKKGQKR